MAFKMNAGKQKGVSISTTANNAGYKVAQTLSKKPKLFGSERLKGLKTIANAQMKTSHRAIKTGGELGAAVIGQMGATKMAQISADRDVALASAKSRPDSVSRAELDSILAEMYNHSGTESGGASGQGNSTTNVESKIGGSKLGG